MKGWMARVEIWTLILRRKGIEYRREGVKVKVRRKEGRKVNER